MLLFIETNTNKESFKEEKQVGALCAVTWYNGGQVFSIFGEPVKVFNDGVGLNQTMAMLLTNTILLTTEAILLGFSGQYFKVEQSEGTPFTEKRATLVKKPGIRRKHRLKYCKNHVK